MLNGTRQELSGRQFKGHRFRIKRRELTRKVNVLDAMDTARKAKLRKELKESVYYQGIDAGSTG